MKQLTNLLMTLLLAVYSSLTISAVNIVEPAQDSRSYDKQDTKGDNGEGKDEEEEPECE